MDAGEKLPGNQYRIQVNVDNGSETCSCASRNDTKTPGQFIFFVQCFKLCVFIYISFFSSSFFFFFLILLNFYSWFWKCHVLRYIFVFTEPPRPFYELIPGMGYYKLHTKHENWYSAKLICESEGTHLAIMNSREEIAVLQEFWRRRPNVKDSFSDDFVFLGFHDIGTEGVWKTIFSKYNLMRFTSLFINGLLVLPLHYN